MIPHLNFSTVCKLFFVLAIFFLAADRAMACAGPGVDVTFIAYAMTLVMWVLAAFSAVLLWPVYAVLRKIRGRKNEPTTESSLDAAEGEARGVSHADS